MTASGGTVVLRVTLLAVALAWWLPGRAVGAPAHVFQDPTAVAVAPDGSVYVTDQLAAQVIKLSAGGRVLARWGGQGRRPGRLNIPVGVAADGRGHVYVADAWNSRVQKFSANGKLLAVWGATKDRLFFRPLGVELDRQGRVYIVDNQDDWVYRLSPTGRVLARLGQFGNPGNGEFRGPEGVTIGARGDLYVSSYNWVYHVSAGGKQLGVWGTLHPGRAPRTFRQPSGLATDRSGNVYVADSGNDRIQKISPSGQVLAIWAGSGAVRFKEPLGIALDAAGDLYVVDVGRRVIKLSPAGRLLAVWR